MTSWIWIELTCQDKDGNNDVTGPDFRSGLKFGDQYPIGRFNFTSENNEKSIKMSLILKNHPNN